MANPLRLLTIPISHYCEKARWALDRASVDYVEEAHAPFFHALHTRRRSPTRSTPQLFGEGVRLESSTEIVRFADRESRELFPSEDARASEVESWVKRLDDELGPHVRRFAYHHLLPRPDVVVPELVRGVPRVEGIGFRLGYLPFTRMMRRAMRIDAAGSERSRERLDRMLDAIDEHLRDGRRWLVGDRFTAADLTLASLLAPLVLPPGSPWAGMPRDRAPEPLVSAIESIAARPAGAFVLRTYADERRRVVAPRTR